MKPMDSTLSLIGIARKAGHLAVGEEPVGAAARAHKARVILYASDAADATVRRSATFARIGGIPALPLAATKSELGGVLGRSSCALVAITDAGLAASVADKIAAARPEEFADVQAELARKAKRVNDRRREKRAHEKKLARQAARPWAANHGKKERQPKK